MANNLKDTTALSNSEPVKDAADKELINLGAAYADGLMSRLDFVAKVAEFYVAETLRHVAPKGKAKVTHTHYAEHAVNKWNEKAAPRFTKGDVMNENSVTKMTSEVGAVIRALATRKDIVPFARSVDSKMRKADKEYSIKTYDAVIKVARVQANDLDTVLTEDKAIAALSPSVTETDQVKTVEAMVKKLGKLAKDFPANASAYETAIAALAPVVVQLKANDKTAKLQTDEARELFIATAVANGHAADAAAAFYDAGRAQKKAA